MDNFFFAFPRSPSVLLRSGEGRAFSPTLRMDFESWGNVQYTSIRMCEIHLNTSVRGRDREKVIKV